MELIDLASEPSIWLCEMTLKNAECIVKVGNNLSEPFDAKRGFRQGDSLYCNFFNILINRITCAVGLRHSVTHFFTRVMPLAYADDVDVNNNNMLLIM